LEAFRLPHATAWIVVPVSFLSACVRVAVLLEHPASHAEAIARFARRAHLGDARALRAHLERVVRHNAAAHRAWVAPLAREKELTHQTITVNANE
jgi:hypothetical protein